MSYASEPASANDRLKGRFEETLYVGLVLATIAHLMVFMYFPELTAPDWATVGEEPPEVVRLEDIPIPQAPRPISRPARPVISEAAAPDATIETFDFEEVTKLPPPPPEPTAAQAGTTSGFEVFTVAPRLIDPAAFQRALERAYPSSLRDAGVGGTVELLLHIDEEGRVVSASLGTSSGYQLLDAAALQLADQMRFTPALNRDRRVAVMVSVPVTFRVRS